MFKLRDFHKNVFVEGNIIFDTDVEVSYVDLVAYSTFDKNSCHDHIIADKAKYDNEEEILYIGNDRVYEDNVIYQVTKEVVSYGYEIKVPNPYNCIYTYNNNILDIKSILESDINKTKAFGNSDISCNLVYRTTTVHLK